MSWTQANDVRTQLQRLWDRGEILAEALHPGSRFPRKLVFKAPTASEMAARFEEVRSWIVEIRALKDCRVESRTMNHRQLGKNAIPSELWIDSLDEALAWLGKGRTFKQFVELINVTQLEQPELLPWVNANALKVVELSSVWSKLLKVVAWMRSNPRPGIYIREVDLPNIDTKFIEQHKTILAELFDIVLSSESIDATVSGAANFGVRYGFRTERDKIRFRILDASYMLLGESGDQDISVDVDSFAELRTRVKRVFITENKTNFLAFPAVPESMIVFGAGYGWDAFTRASWLFHCDVIYWGDIDTHGFAILNQLRSALPHVRALLMDQETARRFAHLAVDEPKPTDSLFEFLTGSELALLSQIRDGNLGPNFRLEQERIDWTYARAQIDAAIADSLPESARPTIEFWSSDFTTYLRPSRCNKRMSLLFNGRLASFSEGSAATTHSADAIKDATTLTNPVMDSPTQLQLLLANLSARHRSEQFSRIADIVDLSQIDSEQSRLSATLSAIASGAPAIKAPLLMVSTRIAGYSVTVFAEADLLRLNCTMQYEVVNFRLVRQFSDHPDIAHELSLFSWAFESLTGAKLAAMYIHNTQAPPIAVDANLAAAFRVLVNIARAQLLPFDVYEPVGWTKCADCSFRTHCWSAALAADDIALLPDVEQELALVLRRVGADSFQSLLSRFNSSELANVQFRTAGKNVRVGKRAESILRSARALQAQEIIWLRDRKAIPSGPTVAVIDFEGLPPLLVPEDRVYLWGIQVFGKDSSYRYSLCSISTADADCESWVKFLDLCETVFQNDPSVQFFHYHHYETTMIRKYIDRYGDPTGIANRILEASCDLHRLLRETVCLPVFSYGLKEVERFLGFVRSQAEFGGDWSIAAYLRATNDASSSQLFDDILQYNAEDIASTYGVLTWLRENAPAHVEGMAI